MKTAIVYMCNGNFLLPALVSAIEARRNAPLDESDVFVVDVGQASAAGDAIARAAESYSVRYLRIDPEMVDGLHVQFARLLMHRFLPQDYSDFIYVDSDTQVWGRLDEFVRHSVAGGKVLASPDPMALLTSTDVKQDSDRWLSHVKEIGVASADYVNAGVFKAEVAGWAPIGEQAAKVILSGKKLWFMDQDLINMLAAKSIERVSMRWNFPGFWLGSGIDKEVGPRLVHFMGNPRPWHGPFYPWGAAAWKPYAQLTHDHPNLLSVWPKLKPFKYVKYMAQQQVKRFSEAPIYRLPNFRDAVRRSEAHLAI